MNGRQLRAIVWLRWRLYANHFARWPAAVRVIEATFLGAMVCLGVAAFLASVPIGLLVLPRLGPLGLLLVWDALAAGFLFARGVHLLVDLQRTDGLSLAKLLTLPVSPAGAFLVNYVGSLASLQIALFVPTAAGLVVGQALARGPAVLLGLPLLAAFVLAVTALTYQFQSWVAVSVMNQQRGRMLAVAVLIIAILVLAAALAFAMIQVLPARELSRARTADAVGTLVRTRLNVQADFARQVLTVRDPPAGEDGVTLREVDRTARWVNVLCPPAWFPLGAAAAAEGVAWPALAATAAFGLVGTMSLRRSYRSVLRQYTGQVQSGRKRTAVPQAPGRRRPVLLVERRLPGVPEPAAAVALATVRSLTRAPVVKLLLLPPVVLMAIVGGVVLIQARTIPPELVPMLACAAMGMALGGTLPLASNLFGFDRDGFQVLVLSGVPRRSILLGKNLAFAPVFLAPALLTLAALQLVAPMPLDLLVAVGPQCVLVYPLLCLPANLASILAPFPVGTRVARKVQPKSAVALRFVASLFLVQMAIVPILIPVVGMLLLYDANLLGGVPACLAATSAVSAAVLWLYHFVLTREAILLQWREQQILEVIRPRTD